MGDIELNRRLELAVRLGRAAGHLVLNYFRKDVEVDRKSDDSPVTIADREAEQFLRREIAASFPEDSIVGEEYPPTEGTSEYRWILDPIDGTKTFVLGTPFFGTLIAVQKAEASVAGVIELPALNERIYASLGDGAWQQVGDGPIERARVATAKSLSDGLYVTTDVAAFADRAASAVHQQLESAAWIGRTWGDCYGYALVATGRALVMIDPIMSLWDTAALLPILKEAGGTFTDWSGQETVEGGEGLATNGHVLPEVLKITQPHAGESQS